MHQPLRRTWPQRLVILASVAVIASAVVSARTVRVVEEHIEELTRVPINDTRQYGRQLLATDTEPGEPVNFLIVGTDSAMGLDPGDPAASGREIDPTGRSLADTIMLVRLDPASAQAWALSIPRDLWAAIPGAQDNKIASAFYIGGAPMLVATIKSMFDVEINHYVQMDFAAFQRVVDTLGGVPVWFPHPARDAKSGLDVAEAGCHVLDGRRALQYVRSRTYTELIDGRWQITQGDDFARIERQQDFLILALDRAIQRGVRNPSTMVRLLEAGSASVTLDQDLVPAELISLGQAFAGFNPDTLHRRRLEVYTLWWPDGSYKGEAARSEANEPILDVFRGVAGLTAAPDAPPGAAVASAARLGAGTGFAAGPAAGSSQVGAAVARSSAAGGSLTVAPPAVPGGSLAVAEPVTAGGSLTVAQSQPEGDAPAIFGRPPEGETCG